ncbi:uncharacterized protein PF3D7_1120000-like [Procambarus clarkii]|uniref:uncharacterized protein PF3D7_1120000-like n=1 Tax=Procambarus clarkii TaxID=6728 RepID=UPI00374397D7
MKEMFAQFVENIKSEMQGMMQEMKNEISNLKRELTAAKEEIRALKENSVDAETQIIIQGESGNSILEGNATIKATFAEMLKNNSEVMSSMIEVAMKTATSQEAAHSTSQLLESKRSVLAVGIKEQEGSNKTEWNDKDKAAVNEILKTLEMEGAEHRIEKIFKLGWYNKDRDRVLKIVFANENTMELILTRKSRLQHVGELKKVFLQRDMTREERVMAAEARKRRWVRGENQELTAPNTSSPEVRGNS